MGAFALATLIASNGVAHAQGDKAGGGGDVLACQENGKTNLYLLDIYEAKLKGQIIDLGSDQLSLQEKIVLAQERYSDLDQTRADRYAKEALKMLQDIEAQENGKSAPNGLVALVPEELKDIDDADEIFAFKQNCKKYQLVRQERPVGPRDPFYTIDQNYWERLNPDEKVATLYHEAIYKEMREHGAKNSKGARVLNGMIMSGIVSNLKSGEYRDFILAQGLSSYRFAGTFEAIQNVKIDAQGEIESITGKFPFTFGTATIKIKNPQFLDRRLRTAEVLSTFNLNSDRTRIQTAKKGTLVGGTIEINDNQTITLRGMKKSYENGVLNIMIDVNGKILSQTETGDYIQGVSHKMDLALNKLIRCSKNLVQKKKNTELAQILLQAARDRISNQNPAAIQTLVDDCKAGATAETPLNIDPTVKQIISKLFHPTVEGCTGKALTVGVGVLFGAKVGLTSITCELSDGSRPVYFGPHLGILMLSFGADVMTGKFTYDGTQMVGKAGAVVTSARDGVALFGIHIPKSWRGSKYVEQVAEESSGNQIDESNEFGVGFLAAQEMLEAIPSLKIFHKKDRYQSLIKILGSGILLNESRSGASSISRT